MDTLYIIGNGFDLYHDLLTNYRDFHHYITQHNPVLEDIFEEYYELNADENYLWTDFEDDLSTFNWKLFFDCNNNLDVQDDNFRSTFVFGLEDDLIEQTERLYTDITEAFLSWVKSIDISTTERKFDFKADSKIITFNYTLLLEEVYRIEPERILHIHGDIENDSEDIILGHGSTLEKIPEFDINGYSNRTMFTDSENASHYPFFKFQKPVDEVIKSNSKTFESLIKLDQIYVLGHSLNHIDIPYFKQIFSQSHNAKWNVSYYNDSEKERHLKTLEMIGIAISDINLFKLSQSKTRL